MSPQAFIHSHSPELQVTNAKPCFVKLKTAGTWERADISGQHSAAELWENNLKVLQQ